MKFDTCASWNYYQIIVCHWYIYQCCLHNPRDVLCRAVCRVFARVCNRALSSSSFGEQHMKNNGASRSTCSFCHRFTEGACKISARPRTTKMAWILFGKWYRKPSIRRNRRAIWGMVWWRKSAKSNRLLRTYVIYSWTDNICNILKFFFVSIPFSCAHGLNGLKYE